jgi:2-polyprenyl-6-methoxyphenol hydroxylase-like FAD-dependent oxidoreductase
MPPPAQSNPGTVLIVGAGPTGLVLALWLTHLGARVRIIDKTSEPGTTSRALGVQARTLEFYRQLGLADDVVAAGVKIKGLNFWVKGSKRAHAPLSDMGAGQTAFPFVLIYPQDVHEKFLVKKLGDMGVQVERSTELVRFDEQPGFIRAVLKRSDGAEETFEATYLAGCDGASSTVRRTLGTEFPGGTYSHLFYVADVEASGPPTNNEIHIDLEETDFIAVFPLTREGHVRLVGTIRDEIVPNRDHLKFDDVRGLALRNLKLEVSRENWFSTYRVHHRVAANFRKGRVFLLGDAAHVHSPVGAQGMNTGIGDAVNLSWKLAAVLAGTANPTLLDSFEPERIAFARKLVSTTDKAFTVVTARGALAQRLRTLLVPFLLPRIVKVAAFRKFMFRTVSQVGIRYRSSAISSGCAGQVHGGDRLPWFKLANGQDNHSALVGLVWNVHVYGEVPKGIEGACEELNLPLHVFSWEPEMKTAGFASGALYLLRPDSYVAIAETSCSPDRLRGYFREQGLNPLPQDCTAGRTKAPLSVADGSGLPILLATGLS